MMIYSNQILKSTKTYKILWCRSQTGSLYSSQTQKNFCRARLQTRPFCGDIIPRPTKSSRAFLTKIKYCAAHKIYHALHNETARVMRSTAGPALLAQRWEYASQRNVLYNNKHSAPGVTFDVFARSQLSFPAKQR